ncbi:glycosyltransferase family 4 protein [Nocardioides solisilvae]|uniref:glycosyltransferase family 4 protein n=1 Tax=Nocardioides solisilvae TaxID=1542435 RepID=UPI000D74A864|nr:glycosyltransferase family 4 protein [Nocardioides solisilvae]
MRVLVYPHAMEMGGSQLNAVELAGAVRDLGHEVVVYAPDGPLVDVVARMGLEVVPRHPSPITPGPGTAQDLRRLSRTRGIDVLHGYEWPPIMECWAAAGPARGGPAVVGTVMSMAVADFLPRSLPLFVGTERLRRLTAATRPGEVLLMEPPVDVRANAPGGPGREFRAAHAEPDEQLVVVVTRLARELKLEGILTAVHAVALLARERRVRLVVVGDGPARAEVEGAAAAAAALVGRPVVELTGSVPDPRGAYDAADVCLGMGGSALRAMAFAKPLVVQGEGGFFRTLTPDSLPQFLEGGWYGRADLGRADAVLALAGQLRELLDDPAGAARLGAFGRRVVERRFSLERAAEQLVTTYAAARRAPAEGSPWVRDSVRSGAGLVGYKVVRRARRLGGRVSRDDFNARPA